MAQLNDTMVQGDLRVTGKVYGTDNAIHLENANLAIPPIGVGDYVGSTGDFFIGSGSGKNLPDTTNNFNIHTTVAHFTGTNYRLSQIATPTSATNPTGIYERGGISSDGITWTFGGWVAFAKAGDITTAIQALDVSSVGGDGKYISAILETDGKISATATTMDTTPTANSTKAVTSGGIKTALDGKYTKPSGGIPKSDLASAVQTSLVNNVTLGNGEALAITFPYSLRTGRSTALVLVSGNNSKYSLIEIGWFKSANTAIATNRIGTHVLASRDSERDSAPAIYVDCGTSESGCAIYLDLNNSKWSTQMSVLLNCENASSVAIGAVSHATASSATDISGNMVWNVDSRRVLGTSSSSSWSGDDTNIPTRGAVEEKISDAMSGDLGGWLGVFTVAAANYKCAAKNFKKGDWMTVSEAGTLTYWPKNGRTSATLAVDANSDVYWTSDGYLQVKPSTAVQVYPVTSLSDWNTLTSTGLYQVASQATNVQNSPADGVTGISCLVSASGGKVLQMAQTNATIFYRAYVTGNWIEWRDVKSAENATNAVNYMTNGQPYGIAARFSELQLAIGNTVNTWMLVNNSNNWVKYNANTGASYDSGTLQSSLHINEIVYAAGNTTELDLRIGIGSITSDEKFALFPPFGYCGNDGNKEIRNAWKRFVRYRITIYNTSDSTAALYAICGGRATNTRAGYWRRGAVVVDYSEYLTPNTDPRGWEKGWLNKVQFATLLAHKWGTWEVWWYRDGPEDDPNFSSYDYMFITTIKAPSII